MGYVRFSTCPHRTDDLMPLRASVPTDYVFRTPRIDRCIYTYFQAIYVYIHIHRIYIYMCMSQLCCNPCLAGNLAPEVCAREGAALEHT